MPLDDHAPQGSGPKPQPPGAERRRHPRIEVDWLVQVEMMIPEETFRPQPMQGRVKNFSKRGMLIQLPEINQDLYRKLLVAQRFVKVYLKAPRTDLEFKVMGKGVWVDYHADAEPRAFCNLGLFFENLVPAEEQQLNHLIENIDTIPRLSH